MEGGDAAGGQVQRVLCVDFPPVPTPPMVDAEGFERPRRPVRHNLASMIVGAGPQVKAKSGSRYRMLNNDEACKFGADCRCSGPIVGNNNVDAGSIVGRDDVVVEKSVDVVNVDVEAGGGKPVDTDTYMIDNSNFPALVDPKPILKP